MVEMPLGTISSLIYFYFLPQNKLVLIYSRLQSHGTNMISKIDWCNYFSFSWKSLKVSISNKSLWQYVVLGITFYFLLGN